ncbi:Kunitz/Bovine pancreatic trypsin inhibitor domain protein [Opisthorchis viverrini]|uniref:Kunitz/Bovine pancreatic trypsin inhibitor domain protein n=1 Tax=Opisthorchis viverrini TaxID=6198 RepID=A0A1S8WZ08_OPIVI|nr:Kunitz/Bovine pancreatic trypsin inhibitor domain protein [Opisthorchis viverrini]
MQNDTENIKSIYSCSKCVGNADPGQCERTYSKFYFDDGDKRCKPFLYLGSGGNENKYDSKKDCDEKCRGAF